MNLLPGLSPELFTLATVNAVDARLSSQKMTKKVVNLHKHHQTETATRTIALPHQQLVQNWLKDRIAVASRG